MPKVGDKLDGTVTTVTDFGLFVDADGLEFLLLLHELAWEPVGLPIAFASVGDTVRFKVIHLADPNGTPRRLGSPKQARPYDDPWRDTSAYVVGATFEGTVIRTASYGVFVRHPLGATVLAQRADKDMTHYEDDDSVSAVITAVSPENRRIDGTITS